jgi:UDP-N-acetylmuramyl pentapeptide phosphotransferase/UDP-N-acetylglucosamine-1-phosphate transferase
MSVALSAATAICSAIVCAALIAVLRPWLRRYALAEPNARSSHKLPTPQGGGIAVVAATIVVSYAALCFLPEGAEAAIRLPIIAAAAALIACVGVLADIRPKNFALRLLLQALAVAAVISVLPPGFHIAAFLPLWVERVALVIGGVWFVNLVNFMDGLDLMTVAEVVPITAAFAVIGFAGHLPAAAIVVSLALCGAAIGFGYFNRPVASVFLGDVGSLPIGLILGWLLVLLAGSGGHAAALLLPLYYLADSTITLIRRALKGERIWHAHRTHFYQIATDRGFTVTEVITRVFAVNLVLAALAVASFILHGRLSDVALVLGGAGLVAWLLVSFARGKK